MSSQGRHVPRLRSSTREVLLGSSNVSPRSTLPSLEATARRPHKKATNNHTPPPGPLPPKNSEPTIIQAFAKVWETPDLLVSFDGANLTLPHGARQANAAWPHVDQSPRRRGLQCVQGLLNLAPNGPRDGGLIVLRGSSLLNEAFFKAHPGAGERTCKCLCLCSLLSPPPIPLPSSSGV